MDDALDQTLGTLILRHRHTSPARPGLSGFCTVLTLPDLVGVTSELCPASLFVALIFFFFRLYFFKSAKLDLEK